MTAIFYCCVKKTSKANAEVSNRVILSEACNAGVAEG